MWATVIAVLGTLAGAALATFAQRAADRAARTERLQQQIMQDLAGLLEAVLRYREDYWLMVARLRAGLDEPDDSLASRYRLRTNVTIARDRLALSARGTDLVGLGENAAWAAIELSDIPLSPVTDGRFDTATENALTAARDRSREAHTALRNAGSTYLQTTRRRS